MERETETETETERYIYIERELREKADGYRRRNLHNFSEKERGYIKIYV